MRTLGRFCLFPEKNLFAVWYSVRAREVLVKSFQLNRSVWIFALIIPPIQTDRRELQLFDASSRGIDIKKLPRRQGLFFLDIESYIMR